MLDRLRSLFKAPERKSLSAPTPEEFAAFTGVPVVAGKRIWVTAAEALRVPAVQLSIKLIAEGVASLDRRVVKVKGGSIADVPDHSATPFLTDRWNSWQSAFEGVRDLVAGALCNDAGGMAWCNRVDGEIREISFYRNSLMVLFDDDTMEPSYTLRSVPVPSADILHVRSVFSSCPLSLARESIGIAAIMSDRAGRLFKNAARPGGWIGFKEDLDAEAFIRMKASWAETYGAPEDSGKTAILWSGAEYNQTQFNSVDSQFLEMRKEQVVEIGRAFGIPPGKLYELSRQTWANMEQASKEWMLDTLEGWCRVTESALTRAVLNDDDRAQGYRVMIDRDDMTRADLVSRATAINSLRASEVLSADEGRDWLGLPPRPADKLEQYRNPNINPDQPKLPREPA